MNFIADLKRRNVFRMAGLYLVAAWLLVQVCSTVLPVFDVPAWALRAVIVVLAIGFVPALVIAWVFELTPQGLKRDVEVKPQESIAPQTARRMDRWLLVVAVLAIGYFAVDKFVLAPRRDAELVARTTEHVTPGADPEKSKAGARSIAVLPFVSMSTDADNGFFSDGLSEEILNSLARIDGMQVVGRTSSFQFKGKNEDLRDVGQKLGVGNVLEGSVRRDGEHARITAQLIRTSDGIHLWSQTYDRMLTDTLAVQLDIAEKVAGVLDVVLDDRQRARMRDAGVKNVDAFIAYQKGLKLYVEAHKRESSKDTVDGLRTANVEFDRATTLEPRFADAYFAAADLYDHILLADDHSVAERAGAQKSALRYLDQAASNSQDDQQRLLILADRQLVSDDWHGLPAQIDAALMHPGCVSPDWLPVFASAFGYGDRIDDLTARVSACDPLNSQNVTSRLAAALESGKAERALAILAQAGTNGRYGRTNGYRLQALLMSGQTASARAQLQEMEPDTESYLTALAMVSRIEGDSVAVTQAKLDRVDRSKSVLKFWAQADLQVAAILGRRDEANRRAAAIDAQPAGPFVLGVVTAYCLCGAPFDLEATPNFKARLAEAGLPWPPPAAIRFPAPEQGAPP